MKAHADDPHATLTASPSAAEPTRTGEPSPAASRSYLRPSAAAQLRDPERYQIIGEHGRGGLGRVSRAHDRDLGRDVAIKELISRGAVSEVRFLREALITARLEHPGIVPVHEAGRWPDGTPFYAMKLVAGRPLRDLIQERTTVAERIGLLHHVIAIADAIAYAHGRNIIHRDLKPANVIVGDFGETVVIDWGLAKDLSIQEESLLAEGAFRANDDNELTAAGAVLGTPAYMAPEQERGEQVDQRADVFAIGAMLWELCSLRKVPPTELHQRHRMLRRAGIDRDLVTIIDKSLDRQPERRYPDAGALASDLKAFKSGARIAARSYSLFALLTHWTRRHQALALSTSTFLFLALGASGLYVHNISTERDRANSASERASAERKSANIERDRAQISQAALLLEKDPTRAAKLLSSLTRSPQRALLLSRAKRGSALVEMRLPGPITKLFVDPDTSSVSAITSNGELAAIDVSKGTFRTVVRGLRGPAARQAKRWVYALRNSATSHTIVTATEEPALQLDAGTLLADRTSQIMVAMSEVYALDNERLFRLTNKGAVLIQESVRSVAGNERYLLICTTKNELIIRHATTKEQRMRCSAISGVSTMAAVGENYAAVLDRHTVLISRASVVSEVAISVSGDYALALSSSGLLALSDANGGTWLVRPGSQRAEMGPAHSARPMSTAVDDRYVAWGYVDGTVMAMDTVTNTTWQFRGHRGLVTSLAIDTANSRILSTAGPDLRVWQLTANPLKAIVALPSKVFNVAVSPDRRVAAMDGSDGWLRTWDLTTNRIELMHRHSNNAFGVAWWRGSACSSGFDGKVLCSPTTPSVGTTQELKSDTPSVRWLISSPDHENLISANDDGTIRELGRSSRVLYSHGTRPYRMAFTRDGGMLASGGFDGSIIVYDALHQRVIHRFVAHDGLVTGISWKDHYLWTSGADGTLKTWLIQDRIFTLVDVQQEVGSFRLFRTLDNGWLANVGDGIVLLSQFDLIAPIRIDLEQRVQRIEISADHQYAAITIPGEVIVLNVERRTIASLPVSSDGIGYVGFSDANTLSMSTGTNLLSVELSSLMYFNL